MILNKFKEFFNDEGGTDKALDLFGKYITDNKWDARKLKILKSLLQVPTEDLPSLEDILRKVRYMHVRNNIQSVQTLVNGIRDGLNLPIAGTLSMYVNSIGIMMKELQLVLLDETIWDIYVSDEFTNRWAIIIEESESMKPSRRNPDLEFKPKWFSSQVYMLLNNITRTARAKLIKAYPGDQISEDTTLLSEEESSLEQPI